LHPQLVGFSWIWEADDGFCDEIRVATGSLRHRSYLRSPLYRAIEFGETIRGDPRDPQLAARYPIMAELAEKGFADYVVMPLTPIDGARQYRMTVSIGSLAMDGLSGRNFEILEHLLRLLSLHVARLSAVLISQNIATAYLGAAAGDQVLEGSIERGAGTSIEAVILVTDVRGFTDMTDRLAAEDVLTVLNAYFERVAGAVLAAGGEVLKFIGDGLLAVFPVEQNTIRQGAAEKAFSAATQALKAVGELNASPPKALAAITGWQPLRIGMALHLGEVFFGNVGTAERLDFTVIGRAVNEAARVEALTKDLGRPLLITSHVAELLARELTPLGEFELRGLRRPVALFAPANDIDQPFAATMSEETDLSHES
jgi:adenylate cyclase